MLSAAIINYRDGRCRGAGNVRGCILLSFLCCAALLLSSANSQLIVQPRTATARLGNADLGSVSTDEGLPQRVDYRDRSTSFDLNLLGVATGMCSLSGDCNACDYRATNPCKVKDVYGNDTDICQIPAGFLGGGVPVDTLCGSGATVDLFVTTTPDTPGSAGTASAATSKQLPAATLTAFRTRGGALTLTVTTRCGWLLVPSQPRSDTASTSSTGQLVLAEGNISYSSQDLSFMAPAQHPASEVQGNTEAERYSCYSVTLPLSGLTSGCQALEIDLTLRVVLQQAVLLARGDEEAGSNGARDNEAEQGQAANVSCKEQGPVRVATGRLIMRPPQRSQVGQQATTTASTPSQAQLQEAKQQLFSNGIAASMSYSAVLDPRSSESADWLASLSSQSPLVAATPTHYSLSFLMGTIRTSIPGSTTAGGSAGTVPLISAGVPLETCGRQTISQATSAVIAALAGKGVTEKHIADVICIRAPYSDVPAAELPPCARYAPILLNVSLEIPLGVDGSIGTVASASTTGGSSSGSLSAVTSSGDVADPQELADTLVQAHLAAPWTCLSTESQMRMASKVQLSVQLPKGPGVEAADAADIAPSQNAAPVTNIGVDVGEGAPSGTAPAVPAPQPAAGGSSRSTTEIAAISIAVTLAIAVALLAFFAIRNSKRAKAAAQAAADAAAVAAIAAAGNSAAAAAAATAAGTGGPPPGKLSAFAAPQPQGLGAEESYLSCGTAYEDFSPRRSPRPTAPPPSEQQQQQQQQLGAAAQPQGTLPWAGYGNQFAAAAAASAGSGSPGALLVSPRGASATIALVAAALMSSHPAGGSSGSATPRSESNASSSTYDSQNEALPTVASVDENQGGSDGQDGALISIRASQGQETGALAKGAAKVPQDSPKGAESPPLLPPVDSLGTDGDCDPLPAYAEMYAAASAGRGLGPGQPFSSPAAATGIPSRRPGRTLRVASGADAASGTLPQGLMAPRAPPDSWVRAAGGPGGGSGNAGRAGDSGYVARAGGVLLSVARGLGSRVGVAAAGSGSGQAAENTALWTNVLFSPRLYSRTSAGDSAEGPVRRATLDSTSREPSPQREGGEHGRADGAAAACAGGGGPASRQPRSLLSQPQRWQ